MGEETFNYCHFEPKPFIDFNTPSVPVCVHRFTPKINPDNYQYEVTACSQHDCLGPAFPIFAKFVDVPDLPSWTKKGEALFDEREFRNNKKPVTGIIHWRCFYCRALHTVIDDRQAFARALWEEVEKAELEVKVLECIKTRMNFNKENV